MPTISVLNTSANLSGKTIVSAENDYTITGNHTFDRDPSAPFTVTASSAKVTNLDADKLDGIEGTQYALWDGTGTSLGQIKFPAAQSASTNANTLDDYEEGTWSPTIVSSGGGTPTYTTQSGRYVKVGKYVWLGGRLTLATKGTLAAGTITVEGLPAFTSAAVGIGLSIGYFANMTTSIVWLSAIVAASSTAINIYQLTAAATSVTASTVADIAATFDVIFGGWYEATA